MHRYFLRGYQLLNSNLIIFLFSVLLSAFFQYSSKVFNQNDPLANTVVFFIYIVLLIYYLGYRFAVFKLYYLVQEGKKLNLQTILQETLKNTKRLIFPFALLTPVAILLIVSAAMMINFTKYDFRNIPQIVPVIFIELFFAFFYFQPVFFSIEGKGFWFSALQSIKFSLQNIQFIGIVLAVNLTSFFISLYLLKDINLRGLFSVFVHNYIILGLNAAILLYYQNKTSSKSV